MPHNQHNYLSDREKGGIMNLTIDIIAKHFKELSETGLWFRCPSCKMELTLKQNSTEVRCACGCVYPSDSLIEEEMKILSAMK